MTVKRLIRAVTALAASGIMFSANANSVGFDLEGFEFDATLNQVSITVIYDFTEFAMFGGGLDIEFDTDAIEFVSYTRAPLPADAQDQASPTGSLQAPGYYAGFGIGTFEFFNGMTSAGEIGTFTFNILNGGFDGSTPCGQIICLLENDINPFVSLVGVAVGDELLANGSTGAGNLLPVPIPAAVWLMLSGLGALLGLARKSA